MNAASRELCVGILGGLGPEATLDFFARILAATPAQSDQDHLHLIIENNPKVPDRHAAIRGDGPDVTPALVTMAQNLERCGADFVVMPCNTAHAFQPQIEAALTIPFVSMVDEVVRHLKNTAARQAVGLMAAHGCMEADLYQSRLPDAGCEVITWRETEVTHFMDLVYRIKAGERGEQIETPLLELARSLLQRGADCLLAACTEIPLILSPQVLSQQNFDCRFISTTDILVQRTLAYARNEIPLVNPATSV